MVAMMGVTMVDLMVVLKEVMMVDRMVDMMVATKVGSLELR